MEKNTALATIDEFRFPDFAAGTEDVYDAEEFDDIEPEFPRVKIPSGGATSFEIPNPEDPDDPIPSKTIEGVIVLQHTANSYWENSDPNGSPPDCYSQDGVRGIGKPGGACAQCALNEFGSGEGGKGKACKNMKNIYLLRSGDLLPLLISLPPTSLKAFRKYANNLRFAGRAMSGVKTVIGLKKEDGESGAYSVATFKNGGVLASGLSRQAREFARHMREQYGTMKAANSVPAADYNVPEEGGIPDFDPETGEMRAF